MKEVKEVRMNVPEGRILSVEIKDGICKLLVEVEEEKVNAEVKEMEPFFMRIEASKLSLSDRFMQYAPKTNGEQWLKDRIEDLIQTGIKDFSCQKINPSVDDNGNIFFKPGEKPALEKSCTWWRENAKKFKPERKSRLGTKTEYIAFIAVLMKTLVSKAEFTAEEAWKIATKEIHRYNNNQQFEITGCDYWGGFHDLAGISKVMLADDECDGFYTTFRYKISALGYVNTYHLCNDSGMEQLGWIVLP